MNMRLTSQRQKSASAIEWGGVIATGFKTPLVFIDKSINVNKDTYFKVIEEKFVATD